MRTISSHLLWLVLAAMLGCKSSPPATPKPTPTPTPTTAAAPAPLEEYFKIRRVGRTGATFSHDESLVCFANDEGGRVDLWVAPVAGGPATQITKVDGFVHGQAFSPTADMLVYAADSGGTELAHLFLTNSKGENPKDLFPDDPKTARADFVRWADDGSAFLYLSNRRDERFLDLYEYTVATGRSERLWESSGKLGFGLASRDRRKVVVVETVSDVNSNLYLIERGKKNKPVLLTPHEGDVLYTPTDFSKDAKTLYFTSDEAGEFTALYSMELGTSKATPILSDTWDVEYGGFSEGFRYFITQTNVDGMPKTVVTEVASNTPARVPELGADVGVQPMASSKSDRYLAAALVGDATPTDFVVIDMEKGTVVRPVQVLPPSLTGRAMATATSIRIPSFDGRDVPAFLFSPAGPGPFAAVIDVHGGPTSQSRRRFDPMRQYLVSKGYVVLVPNVRGSTGYGKTYTKLDNLDLGGGPLKDVVAGKHWLVANAKVNQDKVAIMGGSYGGYMSLAAATFAPGEFAVNVDYFGVSDLKSLVESFPPYWTAFATYIYEKFGDPKNPAHTKYQHDRSPLNFVDAIQKPLLVVQGENDARVKKDQSDRIVDKLKARNIPVHYLVLPGEGHGFSQNESRLAAYQATDRFFDRYLQGDTSVTVTP